jgi:hypothetical protein
VGASVGRRRYLEFDLEMHISHRRFNYQTTSRREPNFGNVVACRIGHLRNDVMDL